MMDYTMHPVHEKIEVPAGSYWVPMHQQRARLIMALLHPAAPDALIRWGFAGSIFQTMGRIGAGPYLTVPIANKVAEEHPETDAGVSGQAEGRPGVRRRPAGPSRLVDLSLELPALGRKSLSGARGVGEELVGDRNRGCYEIRVVKSVCNRLFDQRRVAGFLA